MSRQSGNLYAVCSLDPIINDLDGITVMSCLPVDHDPDGLPSYDTRYVTLIVVPMSLTVWDILKAFEQSRAFSAQWVTYTWEVN